jgi:hypothetical protein
MLEAASGFHEVGQLELRDLAVGMGAYAEAIVELHKENIGKALDLLTDMRKYLEKAAKYGKSFEVLIDLSVPDMLAVSAMNAMMTLDYDRAITLFERASLAMNCAVSRYFKEGTPQHDSYQGLVHLYKAMSKYGLIPHPPAHFWQQRHLALVAETQTE